MADVGIYCKNANIQAYAGLNANTTSKAVAATDVYVLDVEAAINVATRKNWSDLWTAGSLNADVKYILMQTAAARCAMIVIQNDPSAYSSSEEARLMLNVLYNIYVTNIELLKDTNVQSFMVGA
jgi:hypothetical protein